MMKNLNINRKTLTERMESVQASPAADKIVGSGNYDYIPPNTDTGLNIQNQPTVGGMKPLVKYAIMGIGGALVIYLGYRFIFKR